MNLKGKFKNITGSIVNDLATVAAIGAAKKGLSFIPSNIGGKDISPAIKGAAGYLAVKLLFGGSKKGIMQNIATGASIGCLAVAASPILEKVGIGASVDDAYVGGGSEFIRIETGNPVSGVTADNAFVGAVL